VKPLEVPSRKPGPQIKRQILEKCLKRLRNLDFETNLNDEDSLSHFNPDVIVIYRDQTVVFEAQNERASALLRKMCGWETETIRQRERVHVHPIQSPRLIEVLEAAGLKVSH
jgi:hypothetical protein